MVSDFFDFSIYIDAEESLIHSWYVERFMRLRETAFRESGILLPPLCRPVSEEAGAGDRRGPVGQHQSEEPAPEHPADAARAPT